MYIVCFSRFSMSGIEYELNEVVMCKSRPEDAFGYPAKIQEIDDSTPGKKRYQIHYRGWNSRYDVWIEQDDTSNMLFKHTPEVEAEHKKLLDESKGKVPKKKAVEAPLSAARKRKLEREGSANSSQGSVGITSVTGDEEPTIVIPDKLKALLLDDNDLINRQQRQAKLPAHFTIDRIVKDYGKAVTDNEDIPDVAGNDEMLVEYKKGGQRGQSHKEVVLNKHDMVQSSLGILDYFNILLGSQLLYARERSQYSLSCVNPPVGAPGVKVNRRETPELEDLKILPSSIYGIGHLVRLFVKIGPMINSGSYGDNSHTAITRHLTDFLIFLSKNAAKYHNIERDYEHAPNNSNDA